MGVIEMILWGMVGGAFGSILSNVIARRLYKSIDDKKVQDLSKEMTRARLSRILHDANRTTMPRQDTTGAAKVHKMKGARHPRAEKK